MLNNLFKKKKKAPTYEQTASFPTGGGSTYGSRYVTPIITVPWTGEKNPGEIGIIKQYIPDHRALRLRSWQAYAESDVVQGIIESYVDWVIGEGLTPHANPQVDFLQQKGITLPTDFNTQVENHFKLFINSKHSIVGKETSLVFKNREVLRNAMISGDTLVVLNVDDNTNLQVRCYDGDQVSAPIIGTHRQEAKNRGNRIIHGVEVDDNNQHVAYYVYDHKEHKRIPAYEEETGLRVAWLVYGQKMKYDHVRGVPLITAILESIKKLDRYKEAMIAGSEERAKVAYQILHSAQSSNENPLVKNFASALPLNTQIDGGANDPTRDGINLQQKFASTVSKTIFDMPLETELKAISSDVEFSFKEFFESNVMAVCTAVGVPYEVAMKKFGNNFSASRAALKMWEHIMKINRSHFAFQFNQPIFQAWMLLADIRGDISAPGLFNAFALENDQMTVEAYTRAKFIGPSVPHVDPTKEVRAEREKLGPEGKNIPLTSPQEAATNLGGGDIDIIKENFDKQIEGFTNVEAE